MTEVQKVTASNDIKQTIQQVIQGFGGMSQFVSAGETVLIKPNYNTVDPFPASTAPDFLKAVVEIVLEAGAKKVIVGDSSTISLTNHAKFLKNNFEKVGLYELLKLGNQIEIMVFDEYEWITKEIQQGKYLKAIKVPKVLDEVDKIIILPCAKTHKIAQFTGALKLIVGFMFPRDRIRFHMGKVQEKIAEMNTIYQPDLVIMDGRKCFISGGPTKGVVREPGLVLASKSRVAIDIEEVKIIQSFEGNSLAGKIPTEITQIKYARELGIY